jgi:hypothetical protein
MRCQLRQPQRPCGAPHRGIGERRDRRWVGTNCVDNCVGVAGGEIPRPLARIATIPVEYCASIVRIERKALAGTNGDRSAADQFSEQHIRR